MMKNSVVPMMKLGLFALALSALAYSSTQAAKPGGGGGGGCPRNIQCTDVYDPVTCSDGVTYPNACYAYRACATGCSSSGGT